MKDNLTLPGLLQLSGGYWATCALHAAVKLDIFTTIAQSQRSAVEAADILRLDARATEMLLNALAAMGLLVKTGELYSANPLATAYLSKNSPGYLGHIIMHHHHLMEGWSKLHEAVKSGAPVRESSSHGDDNEKRESFLMGMFNLASLAAPKIVPAIDLAGKKRLLDLGGGPGTYAIHFCLHNPDLTATVCDLPGTRCVAERTIASFNLSDRIGFVSGDYLEDELPAGFDVAWLSQILHSDGPEGCQTIIRKAMDSLEAGGILLIQEFILDDTKAAPEFPALFSLNMLIGTPDGRSYSEEELFAMLQNAGAVDIRRIPLELPNGAGVIAARKPN